MTDALATKIEREVASWDGVEVSPHRFGGVEFTVGRRQLGHLHGSRFADLPFPVAVRRELIEAGRAKPHHVLPESGWITVQIRGEQDVAQVVGLFRLNYERPWLRAQPRSDLKAIARQGREAAENDAGNLTDERSS
jgi:hypothetical protein